MFCVVPNKHQLLDFFKSYFSLVTVASLCFKISLNIIFGMLVCEWWDFLIKSPGKKKISMFMLDTDIKFMQTYGMDGYE